jgi:hypothetical protein
MKKMFAIFAAFVAICSTAPVQAASVVLNFPSASSTLHTGSGNTTLGTGGGGVAYQAGDYVAQTFTGTGLTNATSARFVFSMDNYTSAGVLNAFDVLINGVDVGDYSFTSTGAGKLNFDLTYAFASIAGDSYSLMLRASSTVPPGLSSYNWLPGGSATLTNGTGAVPEPATWAMMIGGFGLVGASMRYRRRNVSVSFA